MVSGSATLTLPARIVAVLNASMEHIASAHLNSMVRTIIVSTVAHGNAILRPSSAVILTLTAPAVTAARLAGNVVMV